MKTIYEITLQITVNHDRPMVQDSIKEAVNAAAKEIVNNNIKVHGIGPFTKAPDRVQVEIGKFRVNGKATARSTFGTSDVAFCGMDTLP